MNPFAAVPAHQLTAAEPETCWLIEELWGHDAVGIIGGEPKSFKTFLALSMAVSVASGRPCLGRFAVKRQGRVLLFAAEDALHVVRERLCGMAAHLQLDLAQLDLWVITEPVVRLDRAEDRRRLAQTVTDLQPALLILDPFVRLHQVDENVSAAVGPLLAYLRQIQRHQGCAVALVHHFRKGASFIRPGQALRGSSEFHGWSDSSLYLRRRGEKLTLNTEHRAHPARADMELMLQTTETSLALVVTDEAPAATSASMTPTDQERVIEALGAYQGPKRIRELRSRCRMRTKTLCETLDSLVQLGRVIKTRDGWALDDQSCAPMGSDEQATFPFPGS